VLAYTNMPLKSPETIYKKLGIPKRD